MIRPVKEQKSLFLAIVTSVLPVAHMVPHIAQELSLSLNVLSCLNKAVRKINVKDTELQKAITLTA